MGEPFRPADRVVPGSWWDRPNTKFDLVDLDSAAKAALLRQWATAPYLRAEIARAAKSAQGFANTYGASVNHLRNMCNGHRLPDYPTLALVLSVAGPTNAPDEAALAKTMRDAVTRSTPQQPQQSRPSRPMGTRFIPMDGSDLGGDTTARSTPNARDNVPVPHPDAETVRAAFVEAALRNPDVRRYLSADVPHHPDDPHDLAVEVSVFVAPSFEAAGAQGFVGRQLLAATLWVPADWLQSVGRRDGGALDGTFICATAAGTDDQSAWVRGAQFAVEAGDSPENWDISVVTTSAHPDAGGSIQGVLL